MRRTRSSIRLRGGSLALLVRIGSAEFTGEIRAIALRGACVKRCCTGPPGLPGIGGLTLSAADGLAGSVARGGCGQRPTGCAYLVVAEGRQILDVDLVDHAQVVAGQRALLGQTVGSPQPDT